MSRDFIIRPIKVEETEEARRLIYGVARGLFAPEKTPEEAVAFWDERGVLAEMNDLQKNYFDNGGVFLAAFTDGQMVGTGAFRRYSGETCELMRLWFRPEFQGQGMGYAMLAELMDRARQMGYRRMCLKTDPQAQSRAVAFYYRVGFTDVNHPGAANDELWMEMEL